MTNQDKVVVTGLAWMGGGVGSIESALEEIFREAEQEISLTAYAISNAADLLFEWMETALARGIEIRIIVNQIWEQPPDVIARIRQLKLQYAHFLVYSFISDQEADLHAKVIVVDRRTALVGSSNLSRRGLLTNHELGLVVKGDLAVTVASTLDRLFSNPLVSRLDNF